MLAWTLRYKLGCRRPARTDKAKTGAEKVQQLRELFAGAPELGKKAPDNALEITSQVSKGGEVSELTIIVPLAPGGEFLAKVG